jgi:hypothetical protein
MFYNINMDTIFKLAELSPYMPFEIDGEADTLSHYGIKGQFPVATKRVSHTSSEIPIIMAALPGGKRMPLLKSVLTSMCEKNCTYCAFRSGRDFPRENFKPEDLAKCKEFLEIWNLIKNNPKIFGGMSDGTTLILSIFAKTELIALHGPDLLWGYGTGGADYETESLKQILFNGKAFKVLPDPNHKVSDESLNSSLLWKSWRGGLAEGRLLGGNISVVQVLQGTEFEPLYQDSILFLEGYANSIEELGRRFAALDFHLREPLDILDLK